MEAIVALLTALGLIGYWYWRDYECDKERHLWADYGNVHVCKWCKKIRIKVKK